MDDLITIGKIIRSRGVRGELKVNPFTQDITRFTKLRTVLIDTVPFRIIGVNISAPFVYLKLFGIDSKEKADEFKDKDIQIERINALYPGDDGFLIVDLIGCDFESGSLKGRVVDVLQHGAADVFEIKLSDGKMLMFPFLKNLNLDINIKQKKIVADKNLLDKVAVYD